MRERLLLGLTIIGFIVPSAFVGAYLVDEGFELGSYFSLWTASLPATQLLVDLGIAALAFFVWAAVEGSRAQVQRWWLCIPATLCVGLCFGLPLFLFMRERALGGNRAPRMAVADHGPAAATAEPSASASAADGRPPARAPRR